ncbi:MAG: HD domain-containing protein [Planctomycetota bacterium]|nr:HD domain-containing protein [Planctomycetota bacterium]
MADLVESRDHFTGGHIERTQGGLRILIEALRDLGLYQDIIADWDMDQILRASQLHDVGKIAIRDSILLKPGRLTPEEFEEMKKHTTYGVDIISKVEKNIAESPFLTHAKIFAATHHEKWDGTGYPKGLRGEETPLQGRLMAIADVYDALSSYRPYKEPMSHDDSMKIILDGRGTHFDPILVDLFAETESQFRKLGD